MKRYIIFILLSSIYLPHAIPIGLKLTQPQINAGKRKLNQSKNRMQNLRTILQVHKAMVDKYIAFLRGVPTSKTPAHVKELSSISSELSELLAAQGRVNKIDDDLQSGLDRLNRMKPSA